MDRAKKRRRFIGRWIRSRVYNSAPFIRVIPTNRCNIDCAYCYQRDDETADMAAGQWKDTLKAAARLGTGLISFTGGEPLLWPTIHHAISQCNNNGILTDLTTNGTLLDKPSLSGEKPNIDMLIESGLDYLNVSVDDCQPPASEAETATGTSEKYLLRPGLMANIARALSAGVRCRINVTVSKNNIARIENILAPLMQNVHLTDCKVSFGFALANPFEDNYNEGCYFDRSDAKYLFEFADRMDCMMKEWGADKFLTPYQYFVDFAHFISGTRVHWQCQYPERHGWINVETRGLIQKCTRTPGTYPHYIGDVQTGTLKSIRASHFKRIRQCQPRCLSGCAYINWYNRSNKLAFLKRAF